LSAPPGPLAAIGGCVLLKGREGDGKGGRKGREREEREGEGKDKLHPTFFRPWAEEVSTCTCTSRKCHHPETARRTWQCVYRVQSCFCCG